MFIVALSVLFILSVTGVSGACPNFTTEHGATWISVDWEICDGTVPEDVSYYRLDITDNTLNIHNSTENKFCPYNQCSRNMTLLMPCLDYSVSITLVMNDENATVLEKMRVKKKIDKQCC